MFKVPRERWPSSVDGRNSNRALATRQAGLPFDPDCITRLDAVITALRSAAPQSRHGLAVDSTAFTVQAFWEAYFSNYIEGAAEPGQHALFVHPALVDGSCCR